MARYNRTPFIITNIPLIYWVRMVHICVSKLTTVGSDNGLSRTNLSEILTEINCIIPYIFIQEIAFQTTSG